MFVFENSAQLFFFSYNNIFSFQEFLQEHKKTFKSNNKNKKLHNTHTRRHRHTQIIIIIIKKAIPTSLPKE